MEIVGSNVSVDALEASEEEGEVMLDASEELTIEKRFILMDEEGREGGERREREGGERRGGSLEPVLVF